MGDHRRVTEETREHEVRVGKYRLDRWKKGKKIHQKLQRQVSNRKKVTLCSIGNLEFYVYPYEYPDKIFMGIYPQSQTIGSFDLKKFWGIFNRLRWFLNGEWQKPQIKHKNSKEANILRRRIVSAYNLALDEIRRKKKA